LGGTTQPTTEKPTKNKKKKKKTKKKKNKKKIKSHQKKKKKKTKKKTDKPQTQAFRSILWAVRRSCWEAFFSPSSVVGEGPTPWTLFQGRLVFTSKQGTVGKSRGTTRLTRDLVGKTI